MYNTKQLKLDQSDLGFKKDCKAYTLFQKHTLSSSIMGYEKYTKTSAGEKDLIYLEQDHMYSLTL